MEEPHSLKEVERRRLAYDDIVAMTQSAMNLVNNNPGRNQNDEVDLQLFQITGQLPSETMFSAQFISHWLDDCRQRQEEVFGIDAMTLDNEEYANYVMYNMLALQDECHELLRTVAWKPWVTSGRGEFDADQLVDESVDVMFFLGNLFVAFDVTAEDLAIRMQHKDNVVRMRADGYNPRDDLGYRHLFIADHDTGPWQCFFCHKTVIFDELNIHHKDGNHENNERGNLVPAHKRCHHGHHAKITRAKNRATAVECCGTTYTKAGYLVHRRHKHGEGQPNPTSYNEQLQPAACDECDFVAKSKRGLVTHKRRMHSELPDSVTCTACGEEFKTLSAAKMHQRAKHDAENITCELCDRVCNNRGAYRHHMTESHGSEKELMKCSACSQVFIGMRGLKIHTARIHPGIIV
jgi:hypothetical protein